MNHSDSLSRRRFLEKAFTATVFATVAPGVVLGKLAPTLSKSSRGLLGLYTVSISSYPVLQNSLGSVRISVPGVTGKIIISRLPENKFVAVNERCPHEGYRMRNLDTSSLTFTCEAHGSRFTVEGDFITGSGPANRDLTKYTVTFDGNDTLQIEIDGISAAPEDPSSISFLAPVIVAPGAGRITVRYGLAGTAHVLLTIHSINGAELARLVDDERSAGAHEANLDIGELPSGTYICHIDASTGFVDTRKFIVAR
jgi:nitrite reductase/ring-hydroxylating ferredoxin subunit